MFFQTKSNMKSSFEKKVPLNPGQPQPQAQPRLPKIPGTRPSAHNFQLLIGSGIPALDDLVFPGGIPLGSVVLIEDEAECGYSKMLLKYFLAEGAVQGHGLFEANADFIRNLPDLNTG